MRPADTVGRTEAAKIELEKKTSAQIMNNQGFRSPTTRGILF